MTLRDILWPWGALRQLRNIRAFDSAEARRLHRAWADARRDATNWQQTAAKAERERDALHAELDRLAPKRDAKTGRFVG